MKISIALCTYNGEKYILEQLDSLIHQTRVPDEIIVSDDGSTDKTLQLVKSRLERASIPFRVLTHPSNLGVFKNFVVCMQACTGDVIFPCDQDDVWKLDKLQRHEEMHTQHPDKVLVYSNADVVLRTIDHVLYPLWKPKSIKNQTYSSIANLVYKGRSIAGCCMSIKRDFFIGILPIPDAIYHDDWCASCAALTDGIIGIPDPLIYYRQHGQNVVGIIRGSQLSFLKSLYTNVPFYVESDTYISKRNHLIFDGIRSHERIRTWMDEKTMQSMETFYDDRTDYQHRPTLIILKALTQHLFRGDYRFHHGIFTYLKDLYNVAFMKLFVAHK